MSRGLLYMYTVCYKWCGSLLAYMAVQYVLLAYMAVQYVLLAYMAVQYVLFSNYILGVSRLNCFLSLYSVRVYHVYIVAGGKIPKRGATPRQLYPQERPGTHCTESWVGPRAGLDGCGKISPPPGFDPRTVHPVAWEQELESFIHTTGLSFLS